MSQLMGARQGAYAPVPSAHTEEARTSDIPVIEYKSALAAFFLRLSVAIALGVCLLVAGELYSYLRHFSNERDVMEPRASRKVPSNLSASEREYQKQYDAADKFTYYPYVLWRRRPFQGSMINVGADGIRRTAHTTCDGRNFTVWVFGDSTLWGAGATDDETIPSYLAADYERQGRKVCVVNYGESGWVNTQEVTAVVEELKHQAKKPDVVIFYDGGSEAFTAYQSRRADMPSNYNSFKKYLEGWSLEQSAGFSYLKKTNTYRFLDKVGVKLTPKGANDAGRIGDAETESLAEQVMQNYEQNMDIVGLLAQRFGFRAIFAWYPVLVVGHKPLTRYEKDVEKEQELEMPGITSMYRAAYLRCERTHRQNLYYLGDLFDDQTSWLFRGISHVKPEANRIIADRLFQILQNPSQPPSSKDSDSSVHARSQTHVAGKAAPSGI